MQPKVTWVIVRRVSICRYLVLPDSEVVLLFREFSALIGRLYTDRYGSASGARMSSQVRAAWLMQDSCVQVMSLVAAQTNLCLRE